MNPAQVLNTDEKLQQIAKTLLYEGYSLYPYRRNAIKNQKPVPFGVIFPADFQKLNKDANSKMQTECIVLTREVNIKIHFLHLQEKQLFKFNPYSFENSFEKTEHLKIGKKEYERGWNAVEQEINAGKFSLLKLSAKKHTIPFSFDASEEIENIMAPTGDPAGKIKLIRKKIEGEIHIKATALDGNAYKLQIKIINSLKFNQKKISREEALNHSLLSTHTILKIGTGKFISMQEPSEKWEKSVKSCKNINTWPVLIDEKDDVMLSSPIIIYDYPQINPDSPGDLFDCGEIEEALMLHVNMIPEGEQQKIAQTDGKLKEMLERVKQVTPKEIIKLHGGMKETRNS